MNTSALPGRPPPRVHLPTPPPWPTRHRSGSTSTCGALVPSISSSDFYHHQSPVSQLPPTNLEPLLTTTILRVAAADRHCAHSAHVLRLRLRHTDGETRETQTNRLRRTPADTGRQRTDTDRQTHKQKQERSLTDRQTQTGRHRQAGSQAGKQDSQTVRQTKNQQADRQTGRQTDRDRQTDTDRPTDRQTVKDTSRQPEIQTTRLDTTPDR